METKANATNAAVKMQGIDVKADGYHLTVSTAVYSIKAIKKAAYKFADRASIIISPECESSVAVIFNFAGSHSRNSPEQVISDFCNELLDQDLREIVQRETEPLRNFLIAHAFSRTTLIDENQQK